LYSLPKTPATSKWKRIGEEGKENGQALAERNYMLKAQQQKENIETFPRGMKDPRVSREKTMPPEGNPSTAAAETTRSNERVCQQQALVTRTKTAAKARKEKAEKS